MHVEIMIHDRFRVYWARLSENTKARKRNFFFHHYRGEEENRVINLIDTA